MSHATFPDLNKIALDIQFNAAVLSTAHRLFPCGFLVVEEAPQTYEELIAHLDAHQSMLIWSGGSEKTIYGDPEVNYAFRAWHRWCHWRGRHDFSFEGEYAAYQTQAGHLVTLYGDCPRTHWWHSILYAEIIGQHEYRDVHGHFPDDQRAFVEAYLARQHQIAAE